MNVLNIGHGRGLFEKDNRERTRLRACAHAAGEVHIIIFTKKTNKLRAQKSEDKLFLYPTQSLSRLTMIFSAIRIGRKILRKQNKKDWIISAQDPFEAGLVGYLLARITGVPLNIQEHGDFFSTTYWRREKIFNRIRYYAGIFLLRRADCVRVVSERIKRTLVQHGIQEADVTVLPVRTDIGSFARAAKDEMLRKKYEGRCIILSAARFVPQKNLSMLIDSFVTVQKMHPEALLLLVGTGPDAFALQEQVKKYNLEKGVIFMPWTDDMPSLMKTADIYALSSNYEGWGRVLLEAAAAGLPVVTTDVGAANEIICDDVHGRVVPVGDKKSFTQALSTVVASSELRKRYGAHGQEIEQSCAQTEEEYGGKWAAALRPCLSEQNV